MLKIKVLIMIVDKELLRRISKSERKNILCGVSYLSKCESKVAKEMFEELKALNYGRKGDKILYVPLQKKIEQNLPKEELIYMLYGNVAECVKYSKVIRKQDTKSPIQINISTKLNPIEIAILKQFNINIKYVDDIYQAFAKLSLLDPRPEVRVIALFLPGINCNQCNVAGTLLSMTKNTEIVQKFENNYMGVNVLIHSFEGNAENIYRSENEKYTISTFGDNVAYKHYIKEHFKDILENKNIIFVGYTKLNKYLSSITDYPIIIEKDQMAKYVKDDAVFFLDSDYIFEDIVAAYEALRINNNITIFINAADYEAVFDLVKPILEEQGGKKVFAFGNFEKIYCSFFRK